jgi:hypothetical protein
MTPVDSATLYAWRFFVSSWSGLPLATAIEPLNQDFRPFARTRLTVSRNGLTIRFGKQKKGASSMKRGIVTIMAFLCVVALAQEQSNLADLEARASSQPDNLPLWLELGQAQFRAARGNDAVLLEAAQVSFEHVLRSRRTSHALWCGTELCSRGKPGNYSKAENSMKLRAFLPEL